MRQKMDEGERSEEVSASVCACEVLCSQHLCGRPDKSIDSTVNRKRLKSKTPIASLQFAQYWRSDVAPSTFDH